MLPFMLQQSKHHLERKLRRLAWTIMRLSYAISRTTDEPDADNLHDALFDVQQDLDKYRKLLRDFEEYVDAQAVARLHDHIARPN